MASCNLCHLRIIQLNVMLIVLLIKISEEEESRKASQLYI